MRGVYSVSSKFNEAAATTMLWITAPSDAVVEIISTTFTFPNNDTNEQHECTWQRITAIGPAAGAAVVPNPTESGTGAFGGVCTVNLTGEPTTYTSATEHGYMGFPSLGGYIWEPVPEERLFMSPSSEHGFRLITAPGAAVDVIVRCVFREIGG